MDNPIDLTNPFRDTDLWKLREGVVMLDRHRQMFGECDDLEWIFPAEILPVLRAAWGIPVRRASGLEVPYLAHRFNLRPD